MVIAASAARLLADFGYHMTFICNPDWKEWIESQPFVKSCIPFVAPWTSRRNKYKLSRYSLKDILELGSKIKRIQPSIIWDPRGDLRHRVFLNAITLRKIISPSYPKTLNVYKRVDTLLRVIGIIERREYAPVQREKPQKYLTLFFGSYWRSKQVPFQQGRQIVGNFLRAGLEVKLILEPQDDAATWAEFEALYGGSFSSFKGTVLECDALISRSALLVSTDSAWLHIANYRGVPTVGLFGSLNAPQWAPPKCAVVYSERLIPMDLRYKLRYENEQPLQSICAEKVLGAVTTLLVGN